MLEKRQEHFSETLNFNNVQSEAQHGGNSINPSRNRYDRYSMSNNQAGGDTAESDDLYTVLDSEAVNFNDLKVALQNSIKPSVNSVATSSLNMTGGCGCEGENLSAQQGGANDDSSTDNSESDDDDDSDETPKRHQARSKKGKHSNKKTKKSYRNITRI